MKSRTVCLVVSLLFTTLTAPEELASSFQTRGRQSSNSTVVGTWTLTRAGDADGRTIKFVTEGTQIKGNYFTKQGEGKSISSARLSGGYFYFKVPDLQLYFELRLVGDHFEGKMTAYSTTEKKAPEPVKMTRQR